MIKTEIFLGSHPNVDCFEKLRIEDFIKDKASTLLKQCTILDGAGYYINTMGLQIVESTTVIHIVYEESNSTIKENIKLLCNEYKKAFNQECVLLIHSNVCTQLV